MVSSGLLVQSYGLTILVVVFLYIFGHLVSVYVDAFHFVKFNKKYWLKLHFKNWLFREWVRSTMSSQWRVNGFTSAMLCTSTRGNGRWRCAVVCTSTILRLTASKRTQILTALCTQTECYLIVPILLQN